MINATLITCSLCRNFYADPRQIPCSHSFCFDCISGCFNDQNYLLICPKCDKLHQYNSREEFERRCMRDGFLASMVTQYKRNQSRASAISSGNFSRPSSSMSQVSASAYGFTPIHALSQENIEQSLSERSTPSGSQQPTSNRTLVAKCQSCNVRAELIICAHCENVICAKCINEHQSLINEDIKQEWETCRKTFESISERSHQFDFDHEECETKGRQLQTGIQDESEKYIQLINNYKNIYTDLIEKHRQTYKQFGAHEQVVDEYESIDKRVTDLLKSTNVTAERINDFLFEIEHLETRLDNLNKLLDSNDSKYPLLTRHEKPDQLAFFGTLNYFPLHASNKSELSFKTEDEDYVYVESSTDKSNTLDRTLSPLPVPSAPKKKLLWQLDYKSVPYYVRYHGQQLFVCDKYGYLSIYRLSKPDDFRQKPTFVREVKLFNDNFQMAVSDEDQTIIDSFAVSRFWIIVFKRRKNELHGTIYLFTHEGKAIPNGKYAHNYPSRELTMDTDSNLLWSLDQKQLCLVYYRLPDQISSTQNFEDSFQKRRLHVQFSKPFLPIHISVNRQVLAVLDKKQQAIHVYDKNTRQEIYEYINHYNNTTHFCWDMALFSDNSLLIKLDETSTLKNGPSKHVYLQLDATSERNVLSLIEEIDAYGMIITPTDEVLIGVRISTKGTVKCYV